MMVGTGGFLMTDWMQWGAAAAPYTPAAPSRCLLWPLPPSEVAPAARPGKCGALWAAGAARL